MMRTAALITILMTTCLSWNPASAQDEAKKDGIYATITTKKGDIELELYYQKVPLTVASFVGLAEGNLKFEGVQIKEPFFDGLTFHRVVPNFVIQGGDPNGNGSGNPGYKFFDEFDTTLIHDSEGILSMANSGPNTNGSQFFITLAPTPHLNNMHSVFGKITKGMDVVKEISQGDTMISVRIERVGKSAKKFKASKVMAKRNAELKAEYGKSIEAKWEKAFGKTVKEDSVTVYDGGLMIKTLKEGSGELLDTGAMVQIHYRGKFIDGKIFDESYKRGTPLDVKVFQSPLIRGWHEALLHMKKGEKAVVYIPWAWAYGARGRQPLIPPKTDLIFEMEVLDTPQTKDAHDGHDHHHGHDHDHDHQH